MHPTYTQRDIGKLLKKSVKGEIVDKVPLRMAKNCVYTKEEILDTVIFSVANDNFVEYGSKRLRRNGLHSPSADDVFYHLGKMDEKAVFSTFLETNEKILDEANKYGVISRKVWCGLDIHKMPWFGKERGKNVLGMERIRGTNFGHGYASIECVNTARPFTLGVLPLTQFTTKKNTITTLVNEARQYAKIERLFLDREFFDDESASTLILLKILFVIPAKKNKRIAQIIREAHFSPDARRIPNSECIAYITDYPMKKGKQSAMVKLVVILEPTEKGWDKFAFITNMDVNLENVLEIAESYRSRWGIETGYRVKENVRGKTCSRKYPVRLFLQMLSILLYNIWHLCNLIISVKIRWVRRNYPVILDEFKDAISDSILG